MELTERQSATPCGNLAATIAASGNIAEESDGYTIPEAARLLAWSERTLRDRVKKGKIPAQSTERGYLIAAAVVESLRQVRQPAATVAATSCGNLAATDESASLNGARHAVSPDAAGENCETAISDELRDRLTDQAGEIAFLRDQLQQERSAGQELRVLLARLERTNSELAGALVVKALPPASTPSGGTVRKVRWWQVWRRLPVG